MTPLLIIIGSLIVIGVLILLLSRKGGGNVDLTADEYNLLMTRKFDRYELRAFLVRGDFATTYEAFDYDRNKPVAIRILNQKLIYNDQLVKQFSFKGEMLQYLSQRLGGEHIVQNIRYGTTMVDDEPRPFIVSDYVTGISLAQVFQEHPRLSPRDAWTIINQVVRTVGLANRERIWMRELSPQNILLSADPAGKLSVVLANVGVPFKSLPTQFAAELKEGYYSPEDRRGEMVGEQSDVFALAALMFRMLTGYSVAQRTEGESYDEVTRCLEASLSPNPIQRPSSAENFLKSIKEIQSAKSSMPDVRWPVVLARIRKRQVSTKVRKASDEQVYEHRERPTRAPMLSKQTKDKLAWSAMTGVSTAFLMWIGRKVEGLLASPKKMITAVGLAVIGLAVALWYFMVSPEHGAIVVRVSELSTSARPPVVSEADVLVKVMDKKSQNVAPVDLSDEFSDGEGEGELRVRTNERGVAIVNYRGRFTREDIEVVIGVQPKETYVSSEQRTDLMSSYVLAPFRLKALRAGRINLTIDDVNKLYRVGGKPLPESFGLEVTVSDPAGLPVPGGKFLYNNEPMTNPSPGKFVLQSADFKLGTRRIITFEVEDNANVGIDAKVTSADYGLKVVPPRHRVTGTQPVLPVTLALKRATFESATYKFIVVDSKDAPVADVVLRVNGEEVGKTNDMGEFDFKVEDTDSFWEREPLLSLQKGRTTKRYLLTRPRGEGANMLRFTFTAR